MDFDAALDVGAENVGNHHNKPALARKRWRPERGFDQFPASADCSSSRVTVAVPILPTTIPAATLAKCAASHTFPPAAKTKAKTATTVSPAPVTSYTSFDWVGMCTIPPSAQTRL